MSAPGSAEAALAVYRQMEALQGEHFRSAAAELERLGQQAQSSGWADVAFLADLGLSMRGVLHPASFDPAATAHELDRLVTEAERLAAPALLAHALGLRAVVAAASADTDRVLTDAGRGVAMLDRDDLPALDACTALVVCAAAFNALSLWELVDEMYNRASAICELCEVPLQAAAIAMNRVLVRIEWASELVELGEAAEARDQLSRAAEAARSAIALDSLPDDWRHGVVACASALELCLTTPADVDGALEIMAAQQAVLRDTGDVEMLPLSEVLVALSLLQTGRPREALAWIDVPTEESASSGAHSFRLWIRARAEAVGATPDEPAIAAAFGYATMLATQRRQARRALLGAARSRIAGERLRAERDRLFRDVGQDALTGLGNRRTFDGWLDRDSSVGTPTAMLLIDLDHFKAINDRHGHAVGDEVLRQVGRAIAHQVRSRDLALRLGGDEFVVIIETPPDAGGPPDGLTALAGDRAQRIQQAISTVPWAGIATDLAVSASVGVAVRTLDAHDSSGPRGLYNDADRELYAAKRRRLPN